jgi:replicative DNA helicase
MSVTNQSWLDAQYSVLGAALIEPKVVPRVMTEARETDFSGPCLTVYRAIADVFNSGFPVDPVSVASKLGTDYRSFLVQLMDTTPTAANVDTYLAICREQSRVLQCREIGKQLSESESAEASRKLIEEASQLMSSAQGKRTVGMSDALRRFFEKPDKPVRYLSWPIPELDTELYVSPGKFVVFGAEPSVGKTAFALQCAWHWAAKKKVGFFSFETDPDTLFDRLLSGFVGIPMDAIKTGRISRRDWDNVCQATQTITARKLDLISAAGMTASDIRAKTLEAGYDIIIVDYLQIVSSRGGSRYEQVTNISVDLHTIAQSLGVTVMALAQLSRTEEERAPRNSDLRESGQIEQDADVILMMQLEKRARPSGPRKLFVTKNKEGKLSQILLTFDGRYQRFAKGGPLDSAVAEAADMKQKYKAPKGPPIPAGPIPGQFEMLPTDTDVPFKD